ncbi:SOS response-associated peptidase family protein [Acinetobacter rathckeae]|uniref:SOS response-associated peptidase family protein n=1 Tax=Acinetobacter rathckeae TaxID=2605272 RepID=UPI0018A33017|nr:SOS response-associated peptidase family protein [Acinetobacter rathckeae]MBF7687667.1 SOS response-associated peptidase family protein [Acinetobacter rathckeae]MBF7695069.1 SOS response-associated peptidase family protein [Acinetobacter rathckeae]
MCANFRPLTLSQQQQLNLPEITFDYVKEVFPMGRFPLLFCSEHGKEWREVVFGLVPKWATELEIAKKTYNARQETLWDKPSFQNALHKYKFGVFAVTEFYESKYVAGQPQRWGVRRKDGEAFYIAALYEICKINNDIIRSATMLTMDAIDHPMMSKFHEPGNVKRSVIVIPKHRLDEWLTFKSPNIASFVQGFDVEAFECSHVPKIKYSQPSPQLDIFN